MMPHRNAGRTAYRGKRGSGKRSSNGSTKGKGATPGQDFERKLTKAFEWFESQRLFVFRKVDPPTRVLRFGGKASVVHAKSQFLDFLGVRVKDGRAMMIEAKSTSENRLPINTKKSGVTLKQVEAMRLWYWAGAITGILWDCRPQKRVYWISYQQIRQWTAQAPTRKSLLPGNCQELDVLFTDTGSHPDLRFLSDHP